MIYLKKGQKLVENPTMVVYDPTGYYNDGDSIICASETSPEEPVCRYEAKFIAYGGMVYSISDPDQLLAEVKKLDPESLFGKDSQEVAVDKTVEEIVPQESSQLDPEVPEPEEPITEPEEPAPVEPEPVEPEPTEPEPTEPDPTPEEPITEPEEPAPVEPEPVEPEPTEPEPTEPEPTPIIEVPEEISSTTTPSVIEPELTPTETTPTLESPEELFSTASSTSSTSTTTPQQ